MTVLPGLESLTADYRPMSPAPFTGTLSCHDDSLPVATLQSSSLKFITIGTGYDRFSGSAQHTAHLSPGKCEAPFALPGGDVL